MQRYSQRVSGPILDRIDIRHHVLPTKRTFFGADVSAESSAQVRTRVLQARARQSRRLECTPWSTNAEVPGSHVRCQLDLPPDVAPLERALARGVLSPRGVDKVLRLAWTLADLAGIDVPGTTQLRAAKSLRLGDSAQVLA